MAQGLKFDSPGKTLFLVALPGAEDVSLVWVIVGPAS